MTNPRSGERTTACAGEPFRIAVVGHANTGKTSLLRTLLRDVGFGDVGDGPTTRRVESAVLLADGRPAVELVDTPGLEDSIGFLEALDDHAGELDRTAGRDDPPRALASFLATPACTDHGPFVQEAAAVRQVLEAEAAVYVIDARDRILGRHRDELQVLARCATPVVPVLNFTADGDADVAAWRSQLARAGLHAAVSFDTFVYDEGGERRIYEALTALLEPRRAVLEAVVRDRARERRSLQRASCLLVAELLVDAAAATHVVELAGGEDRAGREAALERFRQAVRDREHHCVRELLALHRFGDADVQASDLDLERGRWGLDLFGPEAMRRFGIDAGGGAAAGAAAGLAIDAALGGMSLGAGALTGAVLGGLAAGGARRRGRRILERVRGRRELRCDESTLELLARRELGLVRALQQRGHAATGAIVEGGTPGRAADGEGTTRADDAEPVLDRAVRRLLDRARQSPDWSRIEGGSAAGAGDDGGGAGWGAGEEPAARTRTVRELADRLEPRLNGRDRSAGGTGRSSLAGPEGDR